MILFITARYKNVIFRNRIKDILIAIFVEHKRRIGCVILLVCFLFSIVWKRFLRFKICNEMKLNVLCHLHGTETLLKLFLLAHTFILFFYRYKRFHDRRSLILSDLLVVCHVMWEEIFEPFYFFITLWKGADVNIIKLSMAHGHVIFARCF